MTLSTRAEMFRGIYGFTESQWHHSVDPVSMIEFVNKRKGDKFATDIMVQVNEKAMNRPLTWMELILPELYHRRCDRFKAQAIRELLAFEELFL